MRFLRRFDMCISIGRSAEQVLFVDGAQKAAFGPRAGQLRRVWFVICGSHAAIWVNPRLMRPWGAQCERVGEMRIKAKRP